MDCLPTKPTPWTAFTDQVVEQLADIANPLRCKQDYDFFQVLFEGNAEKISRETESQRREMLDILLLLHHTAHLEYLDKQHKSATKDPENVLAISGNVNDISKRTDSNPAKQHVLIIAKNNYACILFMKGEIENSLTEFRTLFEEVIGLLQGMESEEREIRKNPSSKDLLDHHFHNESEMFYMLVLINNYSNASLRSQNYGEIVPVLKDLVHSNPGWLSENPMMKRFIFVTLAQIFVVDGKRKKALFIFDLQDLDGLVIKKDVDESPLAILYIKEACHLLAQRGERNRAKNLLEVARKSWKETYADVDPKDLSLPCEEIPEQRKRNPPTLQCLAGSKVPRQRLNPEPGVGRGETKDSHPKEEVLEQLGCPQTLSREPSSSDCTATGLKALSSRREGRLLLFISHAECLVLQVKGLEKLKIGFPFSQPFPGKILTKAEDILSEVHPFLTKQVWRSRSREDKEHISVALLLLLEELLLETISNNNLYKCISLLYNLAKENSKESDDIELYKDCFGKLTYFISFDKLRMLDGEVPLTVVVLCGEKNYGGEGVTSEGKPLFRKIAFQEQRKCQEGDPNRPCSFGCVVFLRSLELLDINDLRRLRESILQSVKILEDLSVHAYCQRSAFVQVVPEINPEKLLQQSLQLRLIAPVLSGPIKEQSVQDLYLQQSQKRLALKNELDLDVFTALFQYTLCNLGIVSVQCKARKKMVCVLKEPPFSVLTLHTNENTICLTIRDVVEELHCDSLPVHGAIQLSDNILAECYEKLGISTISDPKEGWIRLTDKEIDNSGIFDDFEGEDALKKAFETTDRVTKELEYLKEKSQKLASRVRKLLDQLSRMERKASLLQDHCVQTFTSDSDRAKAAEKWFALRRIRQRTLQEEPSEDEDHELEELLESLSNDELEEFLAETKKPDLGFIRSEITDQTGKKCFPQDVETTGCLSSADENMVVQQETSHGDVGKSFEHNGLRVCVEGKHSTENKTKHPWELRSDEEVETSASNLASSHENMVVQHETIQGEDRKSFEYNGLRVCVEGKHSTENKTKHHPLCLCFDQEVKSGASNLSSSDGKGIVQHEDMEGVGGKSSSLSSWLLPSPENTPSFSSLNIPAEETQATILVEGSTQTDSLSIVQEYRDVNVQTDPVQLNEKEILEKGRAEFTRDFAERKLRKSRLPQDVDVFKNRRETIHGSRVSIASFASGETPRDSISSGSLPEPWQSKVSSNETESVLSEEFTQDSILTETSGFSSGGTRPDDSSSSQFSISSQASSHGTEDEVSEKTTRFSVTSDSSEQLHSSIISQESSSWTEGGASEERPQDSLISESLPDPWPSKSSVCSETSSCNVQSNARETNTRKMCDSHDGNASTTVASFGNREYTSLPHKALHEVSDDAKKFASFTPPLPSYLQQDDRIENGLRTIEETDDKEDTDTVWTSQGARPKRTIPVNDDDDDDYIVSGVETSFLARHSRDPWLTQSEYSRSPVSISHPPFLSLPVFNKRTIIARKWHLCDERRSPDQCVPPYQGLPLDKRKENKIFQDGEIYCKELKELPLPENQSDVATGRLSFAGSQSVVPTGTVLLPGNHSNVTPRTVPIPGSQSDIAAGTVSQPGSHPVAATERLPIPGSQSDIAAGKAPLPGSHLVVSEGIIPLSGSHTNVTASTVLLYGSKPDFEAGKVAVSGRDSEVPSTSTAPQPGNQSNVRTISRTPSNGHQPHVEWQHSSSSQSEVSSNEAGNFSSTKDGTDDEDDDSYKTADNSFSSLDSLEEQIKRSAMTWSRMSTSMMFGQDEDHDDEEEDDEEHQSNEIQTENRGETVKNLERIEGRTRETDLEEGATSTSPREDIASRVEKAEMTTGQATTLTAHRVSADVIDAREREIRQMREREREERRKREEEDIARRLETSQRAREQSNPSSPQPARLPVQESISEWPCSHYKRKCAIKFPCCEEFYYCHRCHNNSDSCPKNDMKALHGTHLRCLVCLTEQEITENSHHCINCDTQLAEYFCGICKHFTGNEKMPYHCDPCGICRIHRDRSFHCKVCNVCLDERLRNNHICRPDSGHDECCICLEDAFGGCQILPCSHKVHRDCAIAMLQNGVRRCPVCRHPLNQPMTRGQRS